MRELKQLKEFEKGLKDLSKKHRALGLAVSDVLRRCQDRGAPERANLLTKVGERPIYKERVRVEGRGARGGFRIIYLCDRASVCALAIWAKNGKETDRGEIVRRARQAIELLRSDDLA